MGDAKAARADAGAAAELPAELWIHVSRSLTPRAIGRLCLANRLLWGAQEACLEQSCYHHYPQHADVARRLNRLPMRARWAAVQAHAQECSSCPARPKAGSKQVVLPKHRAILVEWLAEVSGRRAVARATAPWREARPTTREARPPDHASPRAQVSWAWALDSSILFASVTILDHYLSMAPVEQLGV
jgi:hypothetical protein